jgi:hypothetical protein
MGHSYGGWCFACHRPTCQFNSPEQEQEFYNPKKSSIFPLINIEKPKTYNFEIPLNRYTSGHLKNGRLRLKPDLGASQWILPTNNGQ